MTTTDGTIDTGAAFSLVGYIRGLRRSGELDGLSPERLAFIDDMIRRALAEGEPNRFGCTCGLANHTAAHVPSCPLSAPIPEEKR